MIPVTWSEQTEAREIASGHIGVSWIPDDDWSRGKCGLKILQYQAAGLPVVANPVGSHREMIRDGETGYLATTPDEWVAAITQLARDWRRRQQMGLLARQRVESDYSVSAWAETFVKSMTGTCRSTGRNFLEDRSVRAYQCGLCDRTSRPQGESASYSQPDWRSMSLCTPHERSTVAGARVLTRLQEMQASEGIRRMFKPPDWEWSQFGDVGWWCRDGWGEVLLGAEGLRLEEWREEGRLTTIK